MSDKSAPAEFLALTSRVESSLQALQAFRAQHLPLLEQSNMLRDAYNDAVEAAKKFYRENHERIGEKFGDFHVTKKREIDGELLSHLLGPKADGIVDVQRVYAVDRKQYDKAVAKGLIPQDIVERVEREGDISVYGPKKAT